MISCDKCGYGHKTFEEMRECKSWSEMVEECEASGHPINYRPWLTRTFDSCICGKQMESRTKT